MSWPGQTLNRPIIVPSLASIPTGPFKRKNISSTVTKTPIGPRVANKKKNPPEQDNPTKLIVYPSDIEVWKKHGGAPASSGKTYIIDGKGEFNVTAIYVGTSQEAVDKMTSNSVNLVYYAVGTLKAFDARGAVASSAAAQASKERAAAAAKQQAKEKATEAAKQRAKEKIFTPPSSNAPAVNRPARSPAVNAARDASIKAAADKAKEAGAKSAEKVKKQRECAEGKLRPTIQSVRRDDKSLFNVIIEGDRFRNFDGEQITVKFIFDDEVEEYVERAAEIVSFSKTEIVTKDATSEDRVTPSISKQNFESLKEIMNKTMPAFNPINRNPPVPPAPPAPRAAPTVGTTPATNVPPPISTTYTPALTVQTTKNQNIIPTKDISVVTITETVIDTEMLLSGSGSSEVQIQDTSNRLDLQNLGSLSNLSSLTKIKLR